MIMGLDTAEANSAVIETRSDHRMLTLPGPDGYRIEWSPGTSHIPLKLAPSGRLVFATDDYENLVHKRGGLKEEKEVVLPAVDVPCPSSGSATTLSACDPVRPEPSRAADPDRPEPPRADESATFPCGPISRPLSTSPVWPWSSKAGKSRAR